MSQRFAKEKESRDAINVQDVPIHCSICNEIFENQSSFYNHRRRQHVHVANVSLGEHVISVPQHGGLFRCPLVGCTELGFKNIDTFKRHMMKMHEALVEVGLYEDSANSPRKRIKLESPPFDKHKGSDFALPRRSDDTAYQQAVEIECSPLAIHLSCDGMPSSHSVYTLTRNDQLLDLVTKIPFQDGLYSQQLNCVLQIHSEQSNLVTNQDDATFVSNARVERTILASRFPGLFDHYDLKGPSNELIEALNMDFRFSPSLLRAVAVLHTGCLIVNERCALFTLTAEAYSRSAFLDVHGETNMKSIPEFDGISVGTHEEADGGPSKLKLKVGSKSMNVLITMSSMISTGEVFVGPESPFMSKHSDIFYNVAKQESFLNLVKEHSRRRKTCEISLNISSLRQLSSYFDMKSTYHPWRATLDGFDNELLRPTTVFTLADLPGNQGEGVSIRCSAKTSSRILQVVAIAVATGSPLLSEEVAETIKDGASLSLDPSLSALQSHMAVRVTSDPLDFSSLLAPVAALANNVLSKANKKIKSNVEKKLMELFGRRL